MKREFLCTTRFWRCGADGRAGLAAYRPFGPIRQWRFGVRQTPSVSARRASSARSSAMEPWNRISPALDDAGPVADAGGEGPVLLGEEHRHALRLHGPDRLRHHLDDDRGDALGGLVEQDRVRVAHEGAGDRRASAARRRTSGCRAARASRPGWERAGRAAPASRASGRPRAVLAPDLQVLVDGEVGEDAPVLGHVAEPEPGDPVGRAACRGSGP